MLKPNEKQIKEAPKYSIDENGVIKNIQTQAIVTSVAGSSRLTLEGGMRKAFKVSALKNQYFPQEKVEEEKVIKDKNIPPAPGKAVVKELKAKTQTPKEPKKVDNGGKKDKDFFDKVRADYDANPKDFNVMKYSKTVGVSYGRIWSCVKLHQAKLKELKNAK